jgi:hypothetical protein
MAVVLPPLSTPHKAYVLCHRALLGIKLKSADSNVAYSDSDPDAGHSLHLTKEKSSHEGHRL